MRVCFFALKIKELGTLISSFYIFQWKSLFRYNKTPIKFSQKIVLFPHSKQYTSSWVSFETFNWTETCVQYWRDLTPSTPTCTLITSNGDAVFSITPENWLSTKTDALSHSPFWRLMQWLHTHWSSFVYAENRFLIHTTNTETILIRIQNHYCRIWCNGNARYYRNLFIWQTAGYVIKIMSTSVRCHIHNMCVRERDMYYNSQF